MLVIDASAATALCLADDGFDLVPDTLIAPTLLRSEVLSALQGMQWRRDISPRLAEIAVDRLLTEQVRLVRRTDLWRRAREVALSLGWAKTYDAEYVALAQLHDAALLTIDDRMRRRIGSFVKLRTPSDFTS